jgi:hypothetical protein
MEVSLLERLPSTILHDISHQLSVTDNSSLYQFSLTSRRCYKSTQPFLLNTLHLQVIDNPRLQVKLEGLLPYFRSAGYLSNVRRVEITGRMPLGTRKPYPDSNHEELVYTAQLPKDDGLTHVESRAWEPLADFLLELPNFRELVWDTESAFPAVLWKCVLREQKPCRLTLKQFEFRYLPEGKIIAQEANLLRWEYIDQLTVTRASTNRLNQRQSFHAENAILKAVTAYAPHLSDLTIVGPKATTLQLGDYVEPSFEPDEEFQEKMNAYKGNSLTMLRIINGYITPVLFETLTTYVGLSNLRVLVIKGRVSNGVDLTRVELQLPMLRVLELDLARIYPDSCSHVFAHAAIFFRSLPPLRELKIRGAFDYVVFNAISTHHGQTLRKLSLLPSDDDVSILRRFERRFKFSASKVAQLQRECPFLEEFEAEIQRTYSNKDEVGIYRALGTFTHLRSIYLLLDCSSGWRGGYQAEDLPIDSDFSTFDLLWHESGFRNGHLRQCLQNSAINTDLARSIWQVMTIDHEHTALEYLHLDPLPWLPPFKSVDPKN